MICLWNLINTAPNRISALSKIYINYYMEILFLFFWDNKLLSYIRRQSISFYQATSLVCYFFLPSFFINLHWVNVWCCFYIFQRSKFVRKPLGGSNRATSTTIIQDSEFRSNMAHLMDTEAERNRLLARNGYGSDWRSDSTTPSSLQKRTLSAHGQRKEGRCPIITD